MQDDNFVYYSYTGFYFEKDRDFAKIKWEMSVELVWWGTCGWIKWTKEGMFCCSVKVESEAENSKKLMGGILHFKEEI